MTEQGLKYLSDIHHAIGLIDEFTTSVAGYNEFLNDMKTQSAVERQLGIIGEAVNKFDALNLGITLKNSRQIAGMRNRIIHAYDAVDTSIIWAILKNHLPALKAEVKALLF
jgi:uncharacterized protein with HEPN domain